MRKLPAVSAQVVLAVVVLGTSAAFATAPGKNGQIAYRRFQDDSQSTAAIFAANPDGSSERQLTRWAADVQNAQPYWSPDGSTLAFTHCTTRCELWTMNADGTGQTRLGPDCSGIEPPGCEDRSQGTWSRDGTTIAMGRAWGDVQHEQIKHSEVYLVDSTGKNLRRLTHFTDRPYSADVGPGRWSPDGKRLLVEVHNSPQLGTPKGRKAIFVINVDGTGLRRLTPWKLDAGGPPDWSPNGQRILFRTISEDEIHGNLYTIRPNGTGLKQITHYGPRTTLLTASFSPDGRRITFAKSGVGGQPDIFTMRLDGKDIRPVTRTPLWDSQPDWGPASG